MLADPEATKFYAVGERREWRVGSRVALNVYEGDRPVCQCHNYLDAQEIVDAMNALRTRQLQGSLISETSTETSTAVQPECSYCWHAYKSMKCRHGGY